MKAFCVYEVEYPEEGGTMYSTATKEEAIQQYREDTGVFDSECDAAEMGPEHVAIYEAAEG